MIWIKIVRLAVSSYHSAGVLYDLFKELSFSAPVMPPWLSGGEAPLLSPCNLSWVLPFTLHYSQPVAQMPMYLQTSRLRLENNEKAAARGSTPCSVWSRRGLCSVLLFTTRAGRSIAHSQACSYTGAATGLQQIWSRLTILTTLTWPAKHTGWLQKVAVHFAGNYFTLLIAMHVHGRQRIEHRCGNTSCRTCAVFLWKPLAS